VSEDPGHGADRAQPTDPAPAALPVAGRSRGHPVLTYRLLGTACALVGVLLVVGGLLALRGRPVVPSVGAPPGTSSTASPTAGTPTTGTLTTGPPTTVQPTTASPAATSTPAASSPPRGRPAPPSRKPAGPAPTPARPSGTAGRAAARAPLTVLNNTTRRHLAEQAADQLRAGGWQVVKIGNFTGKIPVTTVYYTPGHAAEEKVARSLAAQFPRIRRVLPRYAGLPPSAHGVIVVLAPDW
jgi:cell division septation protein DedD